MILQQLDLKTDIINVPEWLDDQGQPMNINLRALGGAERDKWESELRDKDGNINMDNIRARFLVLSIVDDQGKLVFTPDNAPALGEKSGDVLARLYNAANKLNYPDLDNISKN